MRDLAGSYRHEETDPNQLRAPERERDEREQAFITMLSAQEAQMRDFLGSFPHAACDGRAKSTALTKLDELVMWAKRAIDN
jgi:hypothetical protein